MKVLSEERGGTGRCLNVLARPGGRIWTMNTGGGVVKETSHRRHGHVSNTAQNKVIIEPDPPDPPTALLSLSFVVLNLNSLS